jgi:hypothetical protein
MLRRREQGEKSERRAREEREKSEGKGCRKKRVEIKKTGGTPMEYTPVAIIIKMIKRA